MCYIIFDTNLFALLMDEYVLYDGWKDRCTGDNGKGSNNFMKLIKQLLIGYCVNRSFYRKIIQLE